MTILPPPNGVLILNKSPGASSHDMINKIRRLYQTKTVGHAGTLDPLATGVLPIMVGPAVKLSEYLMEHDKAYTALLRLGVTSDTQDSTGVLTRTQAPIPGEAEVIRSLEAFRGKIAQIPPMHSAIKVGGKKLYQLARAGVEIDRAPREVEIAALEAERVESDLYRLRVECSKGTYIRSLCADIGQVLGCGGVMEGLTRTRCGSFALEASHTLEQLVEMPLEERIEALIPTEDCLDWPEVRLDAFFARLARNGAEIYLSKLGDMPVSREGEQCRLRDNEGAFFGLGEVRDFPTGLAIKPIKLLG